MSLDKNYRQRDRNRNSNTQNGKECPKSKAAPTHLNLPFPPLPPSLRPSLKLKKIRIKRERKQKKRRESVRDEGERRECGIQISFELLGSWCCFLCCVGIRFVSFGCLPNHACI